ncbi:hypothetical protein B0H14DRAFT_2420963, partial [Mycena olivaceomarginata]
ITSPVWRIKDIDPHQDTPVEILHVILLGFVKYFWRDAIARMQKSDKEVLIARLSSFNVSGLGISALAGHTLVNYSGSLTGRDFRAIVQAAPFVLHGLLPEKNIRAWTALSAVVTLVWQPSIKDLDKYINDLEHAIDYFLDCTCDLTLNWFNKPKFHVILHLPAHIRRFGPAMLFATEGFESFNAIIRGCSIHSNRHAPSRDIAQRMAQGNRLRHLLGGGLFRTNVQAPPAPSRRKKDAIFMSDTHNPSESVPSAPPESPWMKLSLSELQDAKWVTCGRAALELLNLNSFGSRLLGLLEPERRKRAVHTPAYVTLANGDSCGVGDAIVYDPATPSSRRICSVAEIVQILGSTAEQSGIADFLLVTPAIVGEAHDLYSMRRFQSINEYKCLNIEDIQCPVNIQHNCADNNCTLTRSQIVYQEREKTAERSLAVQHFVPDDRIVNTAQMRDAEALAPFRFKPASLPRTNIIQGAAELEFSVRKAKAKAKEASSSVPVPPAASEIPPSSSSSQAPRTPLPNVPQVRPVFQNPPSSLRWSSGGDTHMYDTT